MADKTLYYDREADVLCNALGTPLRFYPQIAYNEQATWSINVKSVDGITVSAADLSLATVWQFDIGPAANFNDPLEASWAKTLDADIDSTNKATGIIIPKIDTYTAEFLAGIGEGTENKTCYAELSGYEAGGARVFRFRFEIRAKGTLAVGGTPSASPDGYPTWSEADASYEPIASFVQSSCNFKTVQQNIVGIVPTGKLFRPTQAEILCTAITGASTLPTYKWLADAVELTAARVAENIGVVLQADIDELGGVTYYPAGTIFYMEITSGGASSTHSGKSLLKGVMIDV